MGTKFHGSGYIPPCKKEGTRGAEDCERVIEPPTDEEIFNNFAGQTIAATRGILPHDRVAKSQENKRVGESTGYGGGQRDPEFEQKVLAAADAHPNATVAALVAVLEISMTRYTNVKSILRRYGRLE